MNKCKLVLVMLLWGSIGVITKNINISPVLLTFLRAVGAIPILYVLHKRQSNGKNHSYSLRDIMPFIASGVILGLAWICLFAAFKATSISMAILIYNMCPVYVILLAPIILKESIKGYQVMTVICAFIGVLMIIMHALHLADFNWFGLAYGIISGLLYALLVIINRVTKTKLDSSTSTLIQIISAAGIVFPIVVIQNQLPTISTLSIKDIVLIVTLGVVHTGIAYHIYFTTYKKLSAFTIASYSYLESLFGILLSACILGDMLSIMQIIGGITILGATYMNEFINKTVTANG